MMADQKPMNTKLIHEHKLWQQGAELVAGIDEAGRGPLAGPVVAAAVVFHREMPAQIPIFIDDSKKMTALQRQTAYKWIAKNCLAFGVGLVSAADIDRINIRQAAMLAMRKAVGHLDLVPQHLLVDGHPIADPPMAQTAIVGGDGQSLSIAAASIIAKVVRDQIMLAYDEQFPVYQFASNKGYGTAAHIRAILRHGMCPIHRQSFKPKKLMELGYYE